MTNRDLEERLIEVLSGVERGARAKSYEDSGMLLTTGARGVVLRLGTDEFQITIVRSKGDNSRDE